jgi:phosphotransferase system HPr-like phosphotransfer protein
MAVMSLGIPQDASFTIEVEGDNALDILTELEAILVEHNVI